MISADRRIAGAEDLRDALRVERDVADETESAGKPVRRWQAAALAIAALTLAIAGWTITVVGGLGTLGSFTIETVPTGATIALLDGPGPYKAGMALPPGQYKLEVRAAGHATLRRTIAHGEDDTVAVFELRELDRPPLQSGTESELVTYVERFRNVEGSESYVRAAGRRLADLRNILRGDQSRNSRELTNSVGMEFVRIPAG